MTDGTANRRSVLTAPGTIVTPSPMPEIPDATSATEIDGPLATMTPKIP